VVFSIYPGGRPVGVSLHVDHFFKQAQVRLMGERFAPPEPSLYRNWHLNKDDRPEIKKPRSSQWNVSYNFSGWKHETRQCEIKPLGERVVEMKPAL
jgi:hypothetical protein